MLLKGKLFSKLFKITIFSLILTGCKTKELNIFAFGTYLPSEIVQRFERESGIKVHLTEAKDNETLLAKLKLRQGEYDLAVPSSYVIEKLVKLELVIPLNWKRLSKSNFIPELLTEKYNPTIAYNFPYSWGVTGIIVKKGREANFDQFWNSEARILLLKDMREVLSMVLITLGYDVNTKDPEILRIAFQKLKELGKKLKFLTNENLINLYLEGEVELGQAWSGDYQLLTRSSMDFDFILPATGFVLWFDSWVILKGAKHLEEAYSFLAFLNRPEIAALLAEKIGFSTANLMAEPLIKSKTYWYYAPKWFKLGQIQHDLGEAQDLVHCLWEGFLLDSAL